MSKKRNRHTNHKTVNIKISSTLPKITDWLHNRLFLLGAKFSFLSPTLGDDSYIFIDNISVTPSGFTLHTNLNRKEDLGEVKIAISNLDNGIVNISYQYPHKLSDFAASLVLDVRFHFTILNELPEDILNKEIKAEVPDNKVSSSTLELELFVENATIDQFNDWLVAESKDILSKLFPTLVGLLEIQPPVISALLNNERKFTMQGRLYELGSFSTALFVPIPLSNPQCVYFEFRQLSSTRLRVLCKINKFAIEYFRDLLSKIKHNWPDTGEKIQQFLIEHEDETGAPIYVSLGPQQNILTGEITEELEKAYPALEENISLYDHVFISYSHKDTEYAHELAEELKHNLLSPWIDDRIDYGAQWPRTLQNNLDACPIFVVIMSRNAYDSEYVQNEVARAKRKNKRIFPLLLEWECWLSFEATQYVDVRDKKMPPEKFFSTIKKEIDEAQD